MNFLVEMLFFIINIGRKIKTFIKIKIKMYDGKSFGTSKLNV